MFLLWCGLVGGRGLLDWLVVSLSWVLFVLIGVVLVGLLCLVRCCFDSFGSVVVSDRCGVRGVVHHF